MASSGRYSKFPKVNRDIPAGAPAENSIARAIIPSLSSQEIISLIASERVKRARATTDQHDVAEIEGLSVAKLVKWVDGDSGRRDFVIAHEKKQEKPRSTLFSALDQ